MVDRPFRPDAPSPMATLSSKSSRGTYQFASQRQVRRVSGRCWHVTLGASLSIARQLFVFCSPSQSVTIQLTISVETHVLTFCSSHWVTSDPRITFPYLLKICASTLGLSASTRSHPLRRVTFHPPSTATTPPSSPRLGAADQRRTTIDRYKPPVDRKIPPRNRRTSCRHDRVSRFALSAEIQTPSGPPHRFFERHDQTDPGACDLWISQIDALPDQPSRALAPCINEPLRTPLSQANRR
jgi:hypothetical protein